MTDYPFPTRVIYSEEVNNKEALDLLLKSISSFAGLTGHTFFVSDTDARRVICHSDSLLYLDEEFDQIPQNEWGNPYWSCVTNDTLNLLLQIVDKSLLLAQTMSDDDCRAAICTIDYPILIKGKEFFIHQEFKPLVMYAGGKLKYGLSIIGSSTRKTIESYIFVKSKIAYRFDFKTGRYRSFKLSITLSQREKDILRLVQKGFTIKEMVDILYLSASTIKTHRSIMFKKLHVQSMSEALTVVQNLHLI